MSSTASRPVSVGDVQSCDYLIIGGGTAGVVMANRLSEDGSKQVVLVEAGSDIRAGSPPADVENLFPLSTFNPAFRWPDLKAHMRSPGAGAPVLFQQGRVLGGGSTIMGMWALRGVPDDYDAWEKQGARGWGWADVLPYFCKLEADKDFDGPEHGASGPLPIRRQPRKAWSPLALAVEDAAHDAGVADVADMNADFADGHCTLPLSRHETRRASAGLCYLDDTVRARPNLTVLTNVKARRLRFTGNVVIGVEATDAAESEFFLDAAETIVTAGAVFTPALLLRSGIGPAEELRRSGIEVRVAVEGVGRNLHNHPLLPVTAFLKPAGRHAGLGQPPASTFLRWSSGEAGTRRADMGLYIRSYLVWHALGRHMALIGPVLMQPKATGTVSLDAQTPDGLPVIAFDVMGEEVDRKRMADGVRRMVALLQSPSVRAVCGEPFLLTNAARLNRFNTLSRLNAARGFALSKLLDISPAAGHSVFSLIADIEPIEQHLHDDEALSELVTTYTSVTNHVAGTCRIGPASDPLAVVDAEGRVHGVNGLRVADASVMPCVPSGNTHLPTVMVAEKIADQMRGRR